ncbi:flagellar biosynthesis protein FlhA [Sphingomonas koreensis]|jgi:flagellar biosynthesis protein FlhA|uniref:Flagellar biosynthesis protein FlhA n=1 Tax=Sphingomonas koreensis TaxID=93064 RepID=A0A1L6J9U1_9SPHN|nr:flagellar biosynthesis protein FlhA [Sphingomonas koreensis]APR52606.1 flagellar biosynthesis protein FlhA [Sphingomonas koreensis]MDC7812573.1 flagellar biosynthesis protein FlhA [Sphingomonas koreensis]RSU18269.1 flagellar biosynthesis protein FlhA [Sphingomonas koreensis]RSU28573.1 flagellar biosynthesis protein FlhA [Sphingomonas koreensis]RSU31107.1 flagellar biosynthesis protein FlhA [Sphingomonas koreensis]
MNVQLPAKVSETLARLGPGRDLALALGVTGIIAMLILPMPGWLLDLGLALSITASVLILMTALFIDKPLQLSSFPTILLIVTMLRLGLNLASTRLILGHGHEGHHAAGGVIAAFGEFLMGGETVIGLTIFAILIVINFVVITKGAGRIAEVGARFSLDAMPGKQMAIDADLNAGTITEAQAKERRAEVEAESGFYGAMDGASKFVKGDAIATLLITAINIVVGLIIGVAIHGVPFGEAFETYTILTVGEGLVSQIPALVVSIAAGLLVSKGGIAGKTGAALGEQLGRYPKAFGVVAALMLALALMPGLPFAPFALFGGICAWLAWSMSKKAEAAAVEQRLAQIVAQQETEQVEEPISHTLAIDALRIELGYGLLPMINDASAEPRLDDQVRALRRQMAIDFGFVLPSVRILDNMALQPNEYVVYVKETEIARGELRIGKLLVINAGGEETGIRGEPTKEPVFQLPALWIDRDMREEAGFRGLTVVDCGTVVTTHLTEIVKDNIADLLSYAETQKLLNEVHRDAEKLIADLIPAKISISGVQRVLQNLLAEGVSIRDIPTILEGIAEATAMTGSLTQVTEHVRARLSRQISAQQTFEGTIPVVTLGSQWDEAFAESIVGQGEERHLAMAPSNLQAFIGAVRETYDRFASQGEIPCLLTSPPLRPFVRSIIERVRPATVVLSQNEVHPRARLRSLGMIG